MSGRRFVVEGVEAVRDTQEMLVCVIRGTAYPVMKRRIFAESDVRRVGDRGRLVIPEWLADSLGLLPPR